MNKKLKQKTLVKIIIVPIIIIFFALLIYFSMIRQTAVLGSARITADIKSYKDEYKAGEPLIFDVEGTINGGSWDDVSIYGESFILSNEIYYKVGSWQWLNWNNDGKNQERTLFKKENYQIDGIYESGEHDIKLIIMQLPLADVPQRGTPSIYIRWEECTDYRNEQSIILPYNKKEWAIYQSCPSYMEAYSKTIKINILPSATPTPTPTQTPSTGFNISQNAIIVTVLCIIAGIIIFVLYQRTKN